MSQSQAGYDLLVAPQNRREDEYGVRHTSRASCLFGYEASRARVFESGIKTSGGAAWMVYVALSRRLRRVEAKDGWVDATGCIGPFYPNFIVFYVLCPSDIIVF
jgi:hypothetical protein